MVERHWTRDWLGWLLLAVPIVALMAFANLVRDLGHPFGGYLSFSWINRSDGLVDIPTPIWWPGIIEGELELNGTLLTIDGLDYGPNVRAAMAAAAEAGRNTVAIGQATSSGEVAIRQVPVVAFTFTHLLEIKFPEWINGIAFLMLAVAVYQAQPDSVTNRSFALVAAIVATYRLIISHSIYLGYPGYSNLLQMVFSTTASLVGMALLWFAVNFPKPLEESRRKYVKMFAVIYATITMIVAVLAEMPWLPAEPISYNQLFGDIAYRLMIFGYVVGLIALLTRLTMIAIQSRSDRRMRRISLILFSGMIIAMPMLILTAIDGRNLSIGMDDRVFLGGLDLRYLLVAVAVAFGYVIIRYQSMQSPSRLFLAVLLLAGSGLLAGIAAWVWTLFQPDWPESMASPPSLLFFAVALTSGVVWSLLANWRGALGRLFDWERQSYFVTREFGRRIMGNGDLKMLPQTIADTLAEELALEQVGVWLRDRSSTDYLQLAGQVGQIQSGWPQKMRAQSLLNGQSAPFSLVGGKPVPGWCRPLQASHFEVVAPLQSDDQLIGLIALGGRWDEEIFDDRDLELAELIAQQATLFVVAAETTAELRQMPGRMADVQEQERTRLAQELHDTIQQFLGRLPFYLAVSRDSLATSPERAIELLDRSIGDVEEAAHSLRLIRHNLAPSQLQSGLSLPLSAMATQFQRRTGTPLLLGVSPDIDAQTTLATRHAMYRVIQQALDNVEAHAQASEVAVDVTREDGRVHFSVRDDGRGFTSDQRGRAQAAGSFGLLSMRARLESCGGEMELVSIPGQGTTVCGWVPVAEPAEDGQ